MKIGIVLCLLITLISGFVVYTVYQDKQSEHAAESTRRFLSDLSDTAARVFDLAEEGVTDDILWERQYDRYELKFDQVQGLYQQFSMSIPPKLFELKQSIKPALDKAIEEVRKSEVITQSQTDSIANLSRLTIQHTDIVVQRMVDQKVNSRYVLGIMNASRGLLQDEYLLRSPGKAIYQIQLDKPSVLAVEIKRIRDGIRATSVPSDSGIDTSLKVLSDVVIAYDKHYQEAQARLASYVAAQESFRTLKTIIEESKWLDLHRSLYHDYTGSVVFGHFFYLLLGSLGFLLALCLLLILLWHSKEGYTSDRTLKKLSSKSASHRELLSQILKVLMALERGEYESQVSGSTAELKDELIGRVIVAVNTLADTLKASADEQTRLVRAVEKVNQISDRNIETIAEKGRMQMDVITLGREMTRGHENIVREINELISADKTEIDRLIREFDGTSETLEVIRNVQINLAKDLKLIEQTLDSLEEEINTGRVSSEGLDGLMKHFRALSMQVHVCSSKVGDGAVQTELTNIAKELKEESESSQYHVENVRSVIARVHSQIGEGRRTVESGFRSVQELKVSTEKSSAVSKVLANSASIMSDNIGRLKACSTRLIEESYSLGDTLKKIASFRNESDESLKENSNALKELLRKANQWSNLFRREEEAAKQQA